MASALSNRQNCACARKTLQTQRRRTHGAGCVRQWFRTAEPLGERRYENWNTHTHTANKYLFKVHVVKYLGISATCCSSFVFLPLTIYNIFNLHVIREVKGASRISSKNLIQLYVAMVRPIIEYGCTVWQTVSQTELKNLEGIQRKALALCGVVGWCDGAG